MTIAENLTTTALTPVESEITLKFDLESISKFIQPDIAADGSKTYVVPANPLQFIIINEDAYSTVTKYDEVVFIQPRQNSFYRTLSFSFEVINSDKNNVLWIDPDYHTQSNEYNAQGVRIPDSNPKRINGETITYFNSASNVDSEQLTFVIKVAGPSFTGQCKVKWDPVIKKDGEV